MIVIKRGDCLTRMDELEEGSVDALISDPPYEIGFMSKGWDRAGGIATSKEYWDRVWRILAPGGVVKVFGGTRTFHRMAVAMVQAGFTNISLEAWVYGCLSEDTEILTETGWKSGLSVKVGEKVACWDHQTNAITMMPVQETHYGPFKGDMVKIGDKQLLTPNHRVYTMTQDNVWTVVEASSLKGPCLVPLVIGWTIEGATDHEHVNEQTIDDHLVLPMHETVSTKFYDGVVWCVTVPTGAFVARRKGLTFITGNSGFPKNFDIARAIDKKLGVKRTAKIVPFTGNALMRHGGDNTRPWMEEALKKGFHEMPGDEAVSDEARKWKGWGTALKPAWEPVLIARKIV